ncbi:MAG: hypothetical protein EPO11_00095 [Gammaproteobacteria bacterium]|nr:MAG: hypothetical protein EPO11_00095 [Gammaproteobacteria bacterium]
MATDKTASSTASRQKVTIGIFILIVIAIIWQAKELIVSGRSITPDSSAPTMAAGGMTPPGQPAAPQPAQLPKATAPVSPPQEGESTKLQQETEAKYLAALNELQMLKVSKEIAETNQAIMKAKFDTVAAEKGIIQLLAPSTPQPTPQAYAQGLANETSTAAPPAANASASPAPVASGSSSYTVISVTQLQYKWSAVLGYQGNLYNVSVGDVLPTDGSKVIAIDKSGVVLDKNGEKRKVSLVPII